jgi:amidase
VSPSELLDEARTRCDRVNPKLNAVICRLDEQAHRAAANLDLSRPFAGVPFLAKDLGSALAGAPLTAGSRLFANYVPQEDGELVKRFKQAGLVIFGKTNVPEFGLVPVTEPELFGPCHNPWDTSRTPGGSSGGAAAAVAAGIVPMAHASDGGGSIRIPASCCGLFGLKTSRGLNPRTAQTETVTDDFGVEHVISRSVRDSAAALDAICNRVNAGFLSALETPPKRLKVGVARSAMFGSRIAPEVQTALASAVKLMGALGHEVEDAEPQIDYAGYKTAFLTLWALSTHQGLEGAGRIVGHKPSRKDVEFGTWMLARAGAMIPKAAAQRARRTIWQATKAFAAFFERFDILMSPVLAKPPIYIGQNRLTGIEKIAMSFADVLRSPLMTKALLNETASRSFYFAAFTPAFNMTGQPAMSVPLHWTAGGLPIGIQFAAKLGADGLLLRLARSLEIAQGWAHRRPPVWTGERALEAA